VEKKFKKISKTVLKIVISVGALYYVFTKINLSEVFSVFLSINFWWLLFSLLFFILSKIISAYRLNKYLSCIGVNISTSYNLKLYLLGMFYNIFLPGGIGGDGYKIYHLNKKTDVSAKKIFWSVLLERINGVVLLLCLALCMGYFVNIKGHYNYWAWAIIVLLMAAYNLFIVIFFKEYKSILHITNFQSLLVQLLQVISVFFILLSLGCTDKIIPYLFIFLISSIVAMLPITIGGMGARELTFLYGAQWLGMSKQISVSVSLIFYLITVLVSLCGIYYTFKKIE